MASCASDDNLSRQIDEVEALSSIYGDEWCVIDESSRTYCIAVTDDKQPPQYKLNLQILLPECYPSTSPPLLQLGAPWLKNTQRLKITEELDTICSENIGENVIYLLVEKVREFLIYISEDNSVESDKKCAEQNISSQSDEENIQSCNDEFKLDACIDRIHVTKTHSTSDEKIPEIHHGVPFTERKSTFQGHLAEVHSVEQVNIVLDKLCENKKIANATHNIFAYRIQDGEKNSLLQDCEDDGETAAGGRLLHLLQILEVCNVVVVVSRWYGGILLGPDRFKHINNAARNILQTTGFIENKNNTVKSKKTKHKKATKK